MSCSYFLVDQLYTDDTWNLGNQTETLINNKYIPLQLLQDGTFQHFECLCLKKFSCDWLINTKGWL